MSGIAENGQEPLIFIVVLLLRIEKLKEICKKKKKKYKNIFKMLKTYLKMVII